LILFSHPADFTPVCTTEFMTFATLLPQFDAINCKLLGLSIDSNYSHIAWLRTIKEKIKYKGMENVEVTFPVIADLKMEVARLYGMLHPSADDSHAVRAVFIIDPEGKDRAVLYYPQSTGRNFQEILRILVALQTADQHKVTTPASEKDFSLFAFSPRALRIACRLMKAIIAPARRKAGIRQVIMCVAT
jgi:peroxiredoxin 2/4